DLHVADGHRAAFVHRSDVLRAFLLEPRGELEDPHHGWLVLLHYVDSVGNMISMSVSTKQVIDMRHFLFLLRAGWIPREPRVDVDDLAAGSLNSKRCMTEPGKFDSL